MKPIPGLLAVLCTAVFSVSAMAQEFELPDNITLSSKEDYARYEQDIIKAARWLEATPAGKEENKRQGVNLFVMQWITGSPTVTINLRPVVLKISDKSPQLNMMFMAAYARWCLENNNSKDELKAYTAAIKSILNLYNLGGEVKKNKTIQKALDADKEGKLEDWVKENMDKK